MLKINKKPEDLNELEKLLLEFPDKPWNWKELSRNPNITLEIVEANPDKPWNWYYFSGNPNVTIDFIKKCPDKSWNWWMLSSNPIWGFQTSTIFYFYRRKIVDVYFDLF